MSKDLFEHMMDVSPKVDQQMHSAANRERFIRMVEEDMRRSANENADEITKPQYDEMLKYFKGGDHGLPPNQMVKSGSTYGSANWQSFDGLTSVLKGQLAKVFPSYKKTDESTDIDSQMMTMNATDKNLLTEEDKEVIRNMTWEQIAHNLYQILDDIDTASDMCRENSDAFENMVMDIQAKKNNYLYSPDGYVVTRVSECVCHTYQMDDKDLLEFYENMEASYKGHGVVGAQYRYDKAEVETELKKRGLAEGCAMEAPDEPEDPNKNFKNFVKKSGKAEKKAAKQAKKQARKQKECKTLREGMVDHARVELEKAGLFSKDSDYEGMIGEAVMDLMDAFAYAGHSGFSAAMTKDIFCQLAEWKNLTPLTDAKDEWQDVREYCVDSEPMWQNKRNPSAFSYDEGKTWYSIDDPEFGRDLDEDERDPSPWQDRVEWHTSEVNEAKAIPEELEELAEEALQYKTFEDWTKFDKNKIVSRTFIRGQDCLPTGTDTKFAYMKDALLVWGGGEASEYMGHSKRTKGGASDHDIMKAFYDQVTSEREDKDADAEHMYHKDYDRVDSQHKQPIDDNPAYTKEGVSDGGSREIEVKDGSGKVIDTFNASPRERSGWQAVKYQGKIYRLAGGIRNNEFITVYPDKKDEAVSEGSSVWVEVRNDDMKVIDRFKAPADEKTAEYKGQTYKRSGGTEYGYDFITVASKKDEAKVQVVGKPADRAAPNSEVKRPEKLERDGKVAYNAAFKTGTGQVFDTGAVHRLDFLPEEFQSPEPEAGFVEIKTGRYLTRKELAAEQNEALDPDIENTKGLNRKEKNGVGAARAIVNMCNDIRKETQPFLDQEGLGDLEDVKTLSPDRQADLAIKYKKWYAAQKKNESKLLEDDKSEWVKAHMNQFGTYGGKALSVLDVSGKSSYQVVDQKGGKLTKPREDVLGGIYDTHVKNRGSFFKNLKSDLDAVNKNEARLRTETRLHTEAVVLREEYRQLKESERFDFKAEEAKAEQMTHVELAGAIKDAQDTIKKFEADGMKAEAAKYYDQISVYRKVIRTKKVPTEEQP